MKKTNKGGGIAHFFKHYFGIFMLALLCAVMAVLLIGYISV